MKATMNTSDYTWPISPGFPDGDEPEELPGLCPVSEIYQYTWFFIVTHGALPWWVLDETCAALEESIITAFATPSAVCRAKWERTMAGGRQPLLRWTKHCSPAMKRAVLAAVYGEGSAWMLAGEAQLLRHFALHGQTPPPDGLQAAYWDALFRAMTAQMPPVNIREGMTQHWSGWIGRGISGEEAEILGTTPFPPELQGNDPVRASWTDILLPESALEILSREEPLLADHAGLSELSAQLPALFRSLGWLKPGERVPAAEHATEAVQLLAFLAEGAGPLPDYRLVLHKLLCGLPAGYPLDDTTWPDPQALDIAAAFLEDVAAQSGYASVAELRTERLQPRGKLWHDGEAWRLCRTGRPDAIIHPQ
ncbi:contractile injection system tape measure protein [Chitinophaga lutea]